jgi:neutral ceramidase
MTPYRAILVVWSVVVLAGAAQAHYQAGVATQIITPTEPLWMAGYANRTAPAQAKATELYVKALAFREPNGKLFVLVTSDLLGLTREFSEAVAAEVKRRHNIPRERIMLTASHTHCGPVTQGLLADMYPLDEGQRKAVAVYTARLRQAFINTIDSAIAKLKPADLSHGMGQARFAVNRRLVNKFNIVTIGVNPEGPTDHRVPVLRVADANDKTIAIVFGYACHNTTLSYNRWSGDYAGYAQAELEARYPNAVAMFWAGCGGDQNPNPRGNPDLAQRHGKELADAVTEVLKAELKPITRASDARYRTIELDYANQPTEQQLARDLESDSFAHRTRAKRLLDWLKSGEKLPKSYPHYPVQMWLLGEGVLWAALGGEAVIDYAKLLQQDVRGRRVSWATAYANDVMGYIPSRRILAEGGYEADSSMIYYGHPGQWANTIEDRILSAAQAMMEELVPGD